MATYKKYTQRNPVFNVYQGDIKYLKINDTDTEVYLGFENVDNEFTGKSELINKDTDLSVSKSGVTVSAKACDSTNTASRILYNINASANTGYYTVSYNRTQLFLLNVLKALLTVTYDVWITLINFKDLGINDNYVYTCLFTSRLDDFQPGDINKFDLMLLQLVNGCAFFYWSDKYEYDGLYKNMDVKTTAGTDPYDKSTYGDCYVYNIINRKAYSSTDGIYDENINVAGDYYIFYNDDNGYFTFIKKYIPREGEYYIYTTLI